jgi:hypothetical protein
MIGAEGNPRVMPSGRVSALELSGHNHATLEKLRRLSTGTTENPSKQDNMRARMAMLAVAAAVPGLASGMLTQTMTSTLLMKRAMLSRSCCTKMQHHGYDYQPQEHGGYSGVPPGQVAYPWEQVTDENGQTFYYNSETGMSSWDPPQGQSTHGHEQYHDNPQGGFWQDNYAQQNTPGTVSLSGFSGVAGFEFQAMQNDPYRYLPYVVRPGGEQILSRHNMVRPKLTVSRMQCKVVVAADGTPTLVSIGRGPTLWRSKMDATWPCGPWKRLHSGEWQVLSEGDQISLDQHDPDAAVFAVGVGSAAAQQSGFDLHQYDQHQYGFGEQPTYGQPQNGYAEQQQQQYEPAGYY